MLEIIPEPGQFLVVLDRSGTFPISPHYFPITNEVEWLREFGTSDRPYWVTGSFLCAWTEEWLKVWQKTEIAIELNPLDTVTKYPSLSPTPPPAKNLGVKVCCHGKGKPGKPGQLNIKINNPNPFPLTNLILYISQLPELQKGYDLIETIPPQSETKQTIDLTSLPTIPPPKREAKIALSGHLTFQYQNTESGQTTVDSDSLITLTTIYNRGLNIDDLL